MKCFKAFLITSLLLSFNLFADVLVSEPAQNVKTGDIVEVKILSEMDTEELKSYVHKKIEHNVYVMKFYKEADERFYSLFITELPKKKEESDADEKDFVFRFQGLKIKNIKSKDQSDFVSMDIQSDFKLENSYSKIIYAIIALTLLVLGFLGFKFYQVKNKEKLRKKEREERGNVLIELLRGANSRSEFESIYYRKSEIKELVDCNELVLEEYFSILNQVQFRREWDDSYNKELRTILDKFGIMKVRSGI